MEVKKPTAEQMAKFKKNAQDESLSAEVRAKFQAIVDKFSDDIKDVEEKIEAKLEPKKRAGRKPATSRATKKTATPRATKKTATDIEQAKAEIKAKTGKTEEECEAIIEQYRSLRSKAQEGKRKAEQATATNKKRVAKLEDKGDLIEGTNVKTADAVIESTAKDVAEKIEQQIEAVEEKAQKEAKAEVAKDNTKKTPTQKQEAVEAKVEKKVKEKTRVIVKKVVIDTSALLTSIATSLGKFDKDSQKEFLIKLRSDIDKLLAKYAFGGMTDGATQVMNVQQSNMSSSSVNPTMFAKGGSVSKWKNYDKDHLINMENGMIVLRGTNLNDIKPKDVKGFEKLGMGKYAKGGGVEGEKVHYWEVKLKMPNGEIVYESVIADSKEDAEYYGELTDSANEGAKVLSVKSMGKEKYANGGVVEEDAYSLNYIALMNGIRKSESTFEEFKSKLTQIIKRNDYRMPTAKAFEIAYEKNSFAKGGGVPNLTLEETRKIANETAKALGQDFKLTEESLEVASFDLDFKDEPYMGGSYLIFENGDVVNYALSYKPIAYNYKTKKKYAKGGKVGGYTAIDLLVKKPYGNEEMMIAKFKGTGDAYISASALNENSPSNYEYSVKNSKGKFAYGGGVDKLPANLKKRLDTANKIIVKYNGKPISEAEAIRFNSTYPIPQSGYNGGLKAFKLSNAKGFENATKRDYQTIGDTLIDISRKMSGKDIYADGGVIGQEIVFDDNGEENSGVIKDITNLGDYIVKADDGRTLLAQRDLDVISFGAMRQQGVEQRKKRFGFFDEGGNVSDVEYDDVLAVLEDKLTDSVQELPNSFENSYNAEGQEVEHQSRDGFIAFTDGGFEVRWFETLSGFYGSGYSLPTKALENEKNRQIDLSLEDAKDYFKGEYPEIVEELGEENIDYNSLYEAGYESEAEELSEAEMDMMDGTIMCEIGAYYYTPNNDRGIEGQHTLRLFGLVNLESPYHRSGNLEDRYDIDITFDSIEELAEKVDEGLKEIIDWFNGSHYFKSTEELRIRRMAKGGGVKDKLSYEDFVETLRDDDKINAYTGKETKGMKMYYLPKGHPFLGMTFPHKNKRKAYNEYLKVGNKIGFDSGFNFLMMAKGGLTEHGLREGDKIVFDHLDDDNIDVIDSKGKKHIVDLDKGKRYANGGNVSSMLRNRRGQ